MSSGTEYVLDLSDEAKADIQQILRKIGEEWGEKQIPIYADKIDTALETIHRHPPHRPRQQEIAESLPLLSGRLACCLLPRARQHRVG